VSLKKIILDKLIFTILTTLVITGASSVLSVANKRPGRRSADIDKRKGGNPNTTPLAMGLTRKRGAFNKAIDMLAEGAAGNPSLAPYYHSLRKRVRGKGAHRSSSLDTGYHQASSPEVSALAKIDHLNSDQSSAANRLELEPQRRFTVGDMNFEMNDAIQHWTNYYSSSAIGRRTMMIGIERSNSYLEMARAEFRKAGVPEDLVWLAFVESVWNPRALSPAAAGGLWQFIPSTATDYGLRVESGDDERNDPAKQTRVAATYLHDLYTIFGDWHLSMAAYNSGEPRVMGAIVKNGRADFWELYDKQLLPKETCDYVPKILASIKVASQAEFYGLLAQAEPPPPSNLSMDQGL
jgi:membrane-bound lytic murein transglycosylase D